MGWGEWRGGGGGFPSLLPGIELTTFRSTALRSTAELNLGSIRSRRLVVNVVPCLKKKKEKKEEKKEREIKKNRKEKGLFLFLFLFSSINPHSVTPRHKC